MTLTRIVAALAIAALLAACAKEPPPAEVIRPVLTQVVDANGAASASVYAGEVRARYENDLAFRVGGKVVSRAVEVGQTVRRGQALARIDAQDQQLQVEAARAQLASAEADLTLARAELERNRSLRAQNFISQAVLDAKQNQFNAAEARVRQQRAQLDVSRNTAAYTTLVAERDGVITAVSIEPGQVVSAGQAVARIARPEEREVQINVPENRLAELRAATGLAVVLWTQPDKPYRGRVREVAPNADAATRTFSAKISIVDADDAVRLGMTANVALASAGANGAATGVLVPLAALGDRDGKPVVWVVDASGAAVQPKPVEVGQYREDGVLVRAGLAAGETIVIAGVHKLLPGQKVRVADAKGNVRTTTAAAPAAAPSSTAPRSAKP
jgi:membrane fusion protein, multidrug efflux system